MIKQNAEPLQYGMTRRMDNVALRTSGNAGVVIPVAVAPLLRKDSASGRIAIQMELAEMPKPLENAVIARGQVWFVPRPSLPYYSGLDEYTHAYHGKSITALNSSTRTPPALFETTPSGSVSADLASEIYKTLGIHGVASQVINHEYIDVYNHIHNFRLASHSSKLPRNEYWSENASEARKLKQAFWPRNRMHDIVPDYEQALVTGALDLDVSAGQVPLSFAETVNPGTSNYRADLDQPHNNMAIRASGTVTDVGDYYQSNEVFTELAGTTITTTLANVDKARTTQAFAKRVAAYDGSDFSGFNNDDVVMAELMQGFTVPNELLQRPWLLDSKTVVFGMQERHATDAANLDDSITTGRAQMSLNVNVPTSDYGGVIMATVEVMPERLYERQSDEYLYVTDVDDLPNAMRDIQRIEPVDTVINRRLDTAHSTPDGTFGYEPMNSKWKREYTRLGGEFIQSTPGTPSTTARTGLWQADIVDPVFTSDHWLCPSPFPQDVFSVPSNHCVNISVLQQISIVGITQFGDALVEDNAEFLAVEAEQI
jgi:hypothetical protein